jgi:hypothetical protein
MKTLLARLGPAGSGPPVELELETDRLALSALRVGIGIVLALQALSSAWDLPLFAASRALVQSPVRDLVTHWSLPRISWLYETWPGFPGGEIGLIYAVLGLELSGLILLALGWYPRSMAAVAWLAHLTLKTSGASSAYGAYEFGTIALFYCMVLGPYGSPSRPIANDGLYCRWGRWLLRGHLVLVYFTSGVAKAEGEQWWNGEALWRALARPLTTADFTFLVEIPGLLMVGGWAVVLLEMGYPAFLLWRSARPWLLASTCSLHLGIALTLNLWWFALILIVLNLAALSDSRQWSLLLKAVRRVAEFLATDTADHEARRPLDSPLLGRRSKRGSASAP